MPIDAVNAALFRLGVDGDEVFAALGRFAPQFGRGAFVFDVIDSGMDS